MRDRAISTKNGGHFELSKLFAKITKHKNAYISKTVLDKAILTKLLIHRVSLWSNVEYFVIWTMIINPFNKQFCFSLAQEKQKINIHSEDSTKTNNYHPAKNIHNSFLCKKP